jgi:hypothetical protein
MVDVLMAEGRNGGGMLLEELEGGIVGGATAMHSAAKVDNFGLRRWPGGIDARVAANGVG